MGPVELLEVQPVNVVAPFLLVDRLRRALTEPAAAAGWRPPLDVVDATARIYRPVVSGEAGSPLHGVLLKNYAVVPW